MVAVDSDDVVMFGHRPVGTEAAFAAQMDRVLAPEALEPWPKRIVAKELRVRNIELFKRGRTRLGAGFFGFFGCCGVHGASTH